MNYHNNLDDKEAIVFCALILIAALIVRLF